MKTLTNLQGTVAEAAVPDRPITSQLHIEPVSGFFIRGQLGADGLILRQGETAVLFPLDELLRLAQLAEPALIPPTLNPESRPTVAANSAVASAAAAKVARKK